MQQKYFFVLWFCYLIWISIASCRFSLSSRKWFVWTLKYLKYLLAVSAPGILGLGYKYLNLNYNWNKSRNMCPFVGNASAPSPYPYDLNIHTEWLVNSIIKLGHPLTVDPCSVPYPLVRPSETAKILFYQITNSCWVVGRLCWPGTTHKIWLISLVLYFSSNSNSLLLYLLPLMPNKPRLSQY